MSIPNSEIRRSIYAATNCPYIEGPYDLKVHPPPPQTVVELEANVLDSATLCIPLSNPFPRPIDLIALKQGPCLSGLDSVLIPPKEKINYELVFSPKQIVNSRGRYVN